MFAAETGRGDKEAWGLRLRGKPAVRTADGLDVSLKDGDLFPRLSETCFAGRSLPLKLRLKSRHLHQHANVFKTHRGDACAFAEIVA